MKKIIKNRKTKDNFCKRDQIHSKKRLTKYSRQEYLVD